MSEILFDNCAGDATCITPQLERQRRVVGLGLGSLDGPGVSLGTLPRETNRRCEANQRLDGVAKPAANQKLDQSDNVTGSAATTAEPNLFWDAGGKPVGATTSRARADQLGSDALQVEAATAADLVFDANTFCGINDHGRTGCS